MGGSCTGDICCCDNWDRDLDSDRGIDEAS